MDRYAEIKSKLLAYESIIAAVRLWVRACDQAAKDGNLRPMHGAADSLYKQFKATNLERG